MLDQGLRRALDVPLRSGWVELGASDTLQAGPLGYVEAGAHLAPGWSAFARGFVSPGDLGAMAGVRWQYDW